jgi:hypothetical protein
LVYKPAYVFRGPRGGCRPRSCTPRLPHERGEGACATPAPAARLLPCPPVAPAVPAGAPGRVPGGRRLPVFSPGWGSRGAWERMGWGG